MDVLYRIIVVTLISSIATLPASVEGQSEQAPKAANEGRPTASGASPTKPGAPAINPRDGLTYVWIPAGKFQMGCSPGDGDCGPAEKPAHAVIIENGFWLGQTPVTQTAYQRIEGKNPSHFKGGQRPVDSVDWDDASAYCSAVGMRLPTEAEWEYAARAGSAASRYGDIGAIAWYSGNSGNQTHDVAQKKPNAWNLYDMLGNVPEWMAESMWGTGDLYAGGFAPSQYPRGPGSQPYQSLRGGDWSSDASRLRVSIAYRVPPTSAYWNNGFRCASQVRPGETAPGTAEANSKDSLKYVWIPAGTFQMGCSPGDPECYSSEKPSHTVAISKGFWLGQTLVNQAAYQRVEGRNPSQHPGDQRPVDAVTWDDANSYCSAVGMRLPTEAEWEYAARAGIGLSRYGTLGAIAWYGDNSGSQTHDVAQKLPNTWNLYDMMGDLREWTADWYSDQYYSHSPARDPQNTTAGSMRVQRGGAFGDGAPQVRVSFRFQGDPRVHADPNGFRCAGETLH